MNIDSLNERYNSLFADVKEALRTALESFGGSFYFVTENDPRLEDVDDMSDLELPLIDAYTYNYGNQGNYYVTSLRIGEYGIEIYGVDENDCLSIEDEVQLDHVSIDGILYILENLPESK